MTAGTGPWQLIAPPSANRCATCFSPAVTASPPAKPSGPAKNANPESAERGFGVILTYCEIKLWGRWDSNPHCRAPKARASCQLGYGPFLFASLPANVGVCEWQFGQRKRRFSFLLSSQSPLM